MYRLKKHEVWASDVAQYLNSSLAGDDFLVASPSSIATTVSQCGPKPGGEGAKCLLLAETAPAAVPAGTGVILTENPGVALAHVLLEFFAGAQLNEPHTTAVISDEAKVGRNVLVGAHSVVGPDVEIGDNTRIFSNVVINGPAVIGKDCVIKEGAVIGSEGYGFVEDERGRLVHSPQFGRILIGDRVWIGCNSTIERAMTKDTVIEDEAKVDDLVHIGNGSRVGRKSQVTAGALLAFDVTIGPETTLAPNVSVRERVTIAGGITVGLGSVVINDLLEQGTYAGVPARRLGKKKTEES